ncbi:MAG: acetolactate decarboxylase [Planctomycetes bacterium]|nr:acetolactate decarboxylase [Planctomycetota bacterium]
MLRPLALVVVLVSLSACRTVGWDGTIWQKGTMREVMRDGRTEERARVVEAARGPDVVGIGALTGLAGEISIVDGAVWITRSLTGRRLATTQGAAAEEGATLLVTASVPEWVELPIDREIDLEDVPAWAGFPNRDWTVAPFVVRGHLLGLEAHVLNGACPYREPIPTGKEPVRRSAATTFGTLVGFWARDGAGTLTHADQTVHAHVIVRGDETWTGHVDRVRIGAGSIVRVPRDREHLNRTNSVTRAY